MQSEATHPHHYFNTRTVRAFAGLFGLVLLLLFSSQTALAQDARVQALQDQLDRLHEVVQLGNLVPRRRTPIAQGPGSAARSRRTRLPAGDDGSISLHPV